MARRQKSLNNGETVIISPIAAPQVSVLFRLEAIAKKTNNNSLKSLIKKMLKDPDETLEEGTKTALQILNTEYSGTKNKRKKEAIKSLIMEFADPNNGLITLCKEDIPTGLQDYIKELKELSADEKLPFWRLDKYLFRQDLNALRKNDPSKKKYYPNLSWRLDKDSPEAVTRFPGNEGQEKIKNFIEQQLDLILYTGPDPY
jgi:hypothetical protein